MTKRSIVRVLLLALVAAIVVTTVFALLPGAFGGRGGALWHWLAFVTLGVLSRLTFSHASFLLLWIALVAFGGAIELAQGVLNTMRDMSWLDLQIDLVSSFVGLVLGSIVLFVYRRIRDRRGTDADE